jgi:hypothetical protein
LSRGVSEVPRRPNFFIIGAPKCGTTSLAAWLAEHPQVYMSEPKELDFFNSDIKQAYRDDLDRYERFFAGAGAHHLAVGEASTGYLRSQVAIANILAYAPSAKFVVGLRNPVDMAVSWHGQMITEAWETERDFAVAWRLQEQRRRGRRVPRLSVEPTNLLYGEVCKLGEQIERLYAQVPRERVFAYTLDEMRKDPAALWGRLLAFLEVPHDGRSSFPVHNDTKRRLGVARYGFGLLRGLNRQMAQKRSQEVPVELKRELGSFFQDDIRRLSSLIERDLSSWIA